MDRDSAHPTSEDPAERDVERNIQRPCTPSQTQERFLKHLTREVLRVQLEDPSWSPFEGVYQDIWRAKEQEEAGGLGENTQPAKTDGHDWKWDNIDQSPHSWQSDPQRQKPDAAASYRVRCSRLFWRALDHEEGECQEYRRRNQEVKTVLHWGQRKLLLSEIELLTLALDENMTTHQTGSGDKDESAAQDHQRIGSGLVVYAGAAPGTHIEYLARLFPQADFDLVDPAPFRAQPQLRNEAIGTIRIHQGLFSDELAKCYAQRQSPIAEDGSIISEPNKDAPTYPMVVFLSDIRSADWERMSADETDSQVRMDMERQMVWVETMKPDMSLLKFRLSWNPGKTEYLNGKILFPIWGPITTTEARLLVPRDIRRVDYDNTRYEQQMFYFNTTTRPSLYPHLFPGDSMPHKVASESGEHTEQGRAEKRKLDDVGGENSLSKHGSGPGSQKPQSASQSEHPSNPLDSNESYEDEGFDHCYDCTAEIHVLARYLAKFHPEWALNASLSEWRTRIHGMAMDISKQLCWNRTLRSPNSDPQDRKRGIHKRQYIQGKPAYEIAMNMNPSLKSEQRFSASRDKDHGESHRSHRSYSHKSDQSRRKGYREEEHDSRKEKHGKDKSSQDKE